ncbi:MAG TPA: hypothetical protein VEP71_04785, partial [Gallionella sp.]|nr:hypothetical protein [Gallionella sp.]
MKREIQILRWMTAAVGKYLWLAVALAGMTRVALGAEIQSITWEPGSDTPVLQIRVAGDVTYQVQKLEDGQRLRISFPDSTMGSSLTELQGMDKIKGVYPYLADNGKAVVVDMLMTEPGQLDVQKAEYGYRVVASAAAPAASTAAPAAAAPAPTVVPAPTAATSAPAAEATAKTEEKPQDNAAPIEPAAEQKNVIEDIAYAKLP